MRNQQLEEENVSPIIIEPYVPEPDIGIIATGQESVR